MRASKKHDTRPPATPVFASPLSQEEHELLGKIVVAWAHIEFALEQALMKIHNIEYYQLQMFLGEKQTGSKTSVLRQSLPIIKDLALRDLTLKACDAIMLVIPERNLVNHGIWAFELDPKRQGSFIAASYSVQKQKGPYKAANLPELYRKVVSAGAAIQIANEGLNGRPLTDTRGRRLFIGQGPPPEWL